MRLFILAMLLCMPAALSATDASKPATRAELFHDSHDIAFMMETCNTHLSTLNPERVEEAIQSGALIEPANDTEDEHMVIAYGSFLVALFRMHQQAACMLDDNARVAVFTIWQSMGGLFQLFSKDVQLSALGEVLEWINDHRDDAWHPGDDVTQFKPEAEWATLREQAANVFAAFIYQLAADIDPSITPEQ